MIDQQYKHQVDLLIRLIPLIELHGSFALHGGTAINLFVQDMPRLSVDIDLTFVEMGHRSLALADIHKNLKLIKNDILRELPGIQVTGPDENGIETKLFCRTQDVQVKIEVNTIMRGLISDAEIRPLVPHAVEAFQSFCEVSVVPYDQLYGGKICAALDRQHPRDLFDVHLFMQDKKDIGHIKNGLIYSLLSSNRPLHELLAPRFSNQESAFNYQFQGMARLPFSYVDFEDARIHLIHAIKPLFTDQDKEFLLKFTKAEPTWVNYDFAEFPSIRWKLQNLEKFKINSPMSFHKQVSSLSDVLDSWK